MKTIIIFIYQQSYIIFNTNQLKWKGWKCHSSKFNLIKSICRYLLYRCKFFTDNKMEIYDKTV